MWRERKFQRLMNKLRSIVAEKMLLAVGMHNWRTLIPKIMPTEEILICVCLRGNHFPPHGWTTCHDARGGRAHLFGLEHEIRDVLYMYSCMYSCMYVCVYACMHVFM